VVCVWSEVIEHGKRSETTEGAPQGASLSPLLANVYLHYVFDLWAQRWRRRNARGDMVVVRFADDYVLGFEHRDDAERFLVDLRERFRRFALELHPEKTRLVQFGRFVAERRRERGLGRPETSFLAWNLALQKRSEPPVRECGSGMNGLAYRFRLPTAITGNTSLPWNAQGTRRAPSNAITKKATCSHSSRQHSRRPNARVTRYLQWAP
jgi:hypothetical protein